MRKLQLAFLALILLLTNVDKVSATGDSLIVLGHLDTIFVQNDSIIGKFFYHRVAPKQTIYSLCKFYGLKPAQLQEINPALKVRTIHVDELLKVPISEKLIRVTDLPKDRATYTPVFYEVKPSEGLYRISKNYFSIKPEKLMKMNGMTDPELKLGQLLLLGWVPLDLFSKKLLSPLANNQNNNKNNSTGVLSNSSKTASSKTDNTVVSNNPATKTAAKPAVPTSTEKDKAIIKETINEAVSKVEKEEAKSNTPASNRNKFENSSLSKHNEQGAAYWHKELKGSKGLYVLHKSAAVGSIVSITNPMFNSTVYAKVAGTIPNNNYPDDIKVIVSPEVASKLGARDAKFFVKVSYLK